MRMWDFLPIDLSMSKLHRTLNPKYTYNISDTELSVILTFNIYTYAENSQHGIYFYNEIMHQKH